MSAAVRVQSYEDLVRAIDERRQARGWTLARLNFEAGLQEGYAEKLRIGGARGGRHYGPVSLPLTLAALDLDIVLTEQEPTS